ncbi:protein of unknown function [Ectopseudomonas oleovorans]|nr:protein of unknown function [Pseudomonas oleovorans]
MRLPRSSGPVTALVTPRHTPARASPERGTGSSTLPPRRPHNLTAFAHSYTILLQN